MFNKLPIVLKPDITSECWTYYKFAIMQTSEFYSEWLLSHIQLVTYSNGRCIFGNDDQFYPLSYFNEILDIEDGHLNNIPPEKIVTYLKKMIFSRKYVILDLNFFKVYNIDKEGFHLHETLIYGYDDEEEIFFTTLTCKEGMVEAKISFKTIEKAYQDVYEFYQKDLSRFFNRKLYFFGITLISLKSLYSNANKDYDFIKKLNKSLDKKVYKRANGSTKKNECEYTLSVCRYRYILKMLNQLLENNQNEKEAYKSLLKIYEYHSVNISAMSTFFEKEHEILSSYIEYCNKCYVILQKFSKYILTHNVELLKTIINDVRRLESEEIAVIQSCIKYLQQQFLEKYR